MPTTPKYALPYPALSDPADAPANFSSLATAVEGAGPMAWATTGGDLVVPQNVRAAAFMGTHVAGGGVFHVQQPSDTTGYRWYVESDGSMNWGTGGTSAADTKLYRSGVNYLRTPGYLAVDGNVLTGFGTAAQIQISSDGRIYFGSLNDAALFRWGANAIAFNAGGWGTLLAAAFSVQSDRKTKSEIEQAEPLHEQLLSAGVYRYRRDGAETKHLGLMADELPDAVLNDGIDPTDGVGAMQFVDLYALCAVFVQTVQHLNDRLTALEGSAA